MLRISVQQVSKYWSLGVSIVCRSMKRVNAEATNDDVRLVIDVATDCMTTDCPVFHAIYIWPAHLCSHCSSGLEPSIFIIGFSGIRSHAKLAPESMQSARFRDRRNMLP